MGRRPSCGEIVSALRRGFEKAWHVSLVEASPERDEKELAGRLAGERYRSLVQ
jgi:lipoate-protein ligase A